ncbi:MAG TPA: hypothetical protein VG818_12315, partial [Gemmatimonadaceae bacterium]|nr:hypothetical protein [Gemmatimonadaceae bacterium]
LLELERLAEHRYVSPYERGLVYLALGEHERAVSRFREARERRDGWVPYTGIDPRLRAALADVDVASALGRAPVR